MLNMLEEIIGELRGKVTGHRVSSVESFPEVESSFQDMGKILGVEVRDVGTFWHIFKEAGIFYGQGQGVLFTKDGETVTWTAQSMGGARGEGSEWRASILFDTSSKKLSRLNGITGIAEYEIDKDGNAKEKIWNDYRNKDGGAKMTYIIATNKKFGTKKKTK